MKCECGAKLKEVEGLDPNRVTYNYYRCDSCGNEFLDKDQLFAVAKKYKKMKQYTAKLSKWGFSLGIRIPKDLVKRYKLKESREISIIPEEDGLKLVL